MQTLSIEKIPVAIKQEEDAKDLPLPKYMSDAASGMDLYAAVKEDVVLKPLERTLIPTGISIALPVGYEAQIRPRSGLALKQGISLVNTPGTIDADYRGKIGVILINLGQEDVTITRGMRVCQMVIQPIVHAELEIVNELDETTRAAGGFGHTGI